MKTETKIPADARRIAGGRRSLLVLTLALMFGAVSAAISNEMEDNDRTPDDFNRSGNIQNTGQPSNQAVQAGANGAADGSLDAAAAAATDQEGMEDGDRAPEGFNEKGNVLIADQFNNRVIEVGPDGGIVWSFGLGPKDFTEKSIIGCNDAERIGRFTLMAGTGTPAGVIPQSPKGAPDNRVLIVDEAGKVIWQYGQFGQTGSGPNLLNTPVHSILLPEMHVLITDQGNNRVIEVSPGKEIVWQYPGTNKNAADQLSSPNSAELLKNGNILIADENNNRAIEVDHQDKIVRTFTAGGTVSTVAFASRLPDGHTLLTDSGNARIVEVDQNDSVVWTYFTNKDPHSIPAPQPTRAVRLKNGDTLISDQFNNRVIRVDAKGVIVASFGLPLAGGTSPIGTNSGYDTKSVQKGLYAPYDAKVIGDYTGLTRPRDLDDEGDDEQGEDGGGD